MDSNHFTSVVLIVGLLLVGSAYAEVPKKEVNAPADDVSSSIENGKTEWGLLGGAGSAHVIANSKADRQFIQLGGRIGRVLTNPVGPGWLNGHFEASLEILPTFVMLQEDSSYGASFTLLFRHYMAPGRRLRPFVSIGAGMLFSSKQIPTGTSRANFTPQIGFGLAFSKDQRLVYSFEYRLHHISNADTADFNPGVNSSYFQFGVSLFR